MVLVWLLRTRGFLFCAFDVNRVGGHVIGFCFQVNFELLQGRVQLLRTGGFLLCAIDGRRCGGGSLVAQPCVTLLVGAVGIGALHLPYTVVPAQLEALLAALASRATNGSTSAPLIQNSPEGNSRR